MRPSRRTQPYRKGPRQPGPALDAMRKGAPFFLPNPASLLYQRILRRVYRSRR